ncbi:hypothetical protein [Flavobacterium cellulosilyticum]|uniref:hypothetical protein n=1 Tax=Flavobacterium cellulosilyticum TaxID=2541731 RepID=UPI001404ED3A|nr:hypothetical protein [Flavobacterium cellulosilyticum]
MKWVVSHGIEIVFYATTAKVGLFNDEKLLNRATLDKSCTCFCGVFEKVGGIAK